MRRAKAAEAVEDGFPIEVQAVCGASFSVKGNSAKHTVAELKERLVSEDGRFRTHRADLVMGSKVLGDEETLHECGMSSGARLAAVFSDLRAAVLVIGGGVAGRTSVQELSAALPDRWIIVVDPQEFFEHSSGILRAYAHPASWEAIVSPFEDAFSRYPNVQFVQGEVLRLRQGSATVESVRDGSEFTVRFDYCIVATGCGFAAHSVHRESMWKPPSKASTRSELQGKDLEQRMVIGRRKQILEEHSRLSTVHDHKGAVLVVGADYHGVEWACDLRHYFPGLNVILVDVLPRCLTTLPPDAAEYAEKYMQAKGIRTFYGVKYDPESQEFWQKVGLTGPVDVTYIVHGFSAQNSFMPLETTSLKGPSGGGWIVTNAKLQVCIRQGSDRPESVWAAGRIFAVGDCHYGAVARTGKSAGQEVVGPSIADLKSRFVVPPVPKTAFAAVAFAKLACRNVLSSMGRWPLEEIDWPVESGIIAVSLGTDDGVVAWKLNWARDSGEVVLYGEAAAEMKKRLTWPYNGDFFLTPTKWLRTFKEGIPAGRLFLERGRSALRLGSRAW